MTTILPLAAAPVLKVKANPIGLPLTSASAQVKAQLLPQPEKQLMFRPSSFTSTVISSTVTDSFKK
jgi:hypothetical protein